MVEGVRVILLGTIVKPYGKVCAVLALQGERYYMLLGKRGEVSMMPGFAIEGLVDASPPGAAAGGNQAQPDVWSQKLQQT